VTLAQPGLLATPEARLALACLRRLADPSDTLAAAEVVALEGAHPPEQWLQNRLEYVASRETDGGKRGEDRWGLEPEFVNASLAALDAARGHLKVFSPTEAFDTALLAADVLGTVSAWGPSAARVAQRRANLEALRGLLANYEESRATTHLPATIAGFLFWCEELERDETDWRAVDTQSEAIYVGTYHSAKGLEWPVVICSDLDSEPKSRIWEVTVTAQDPARPLDLDAPLANRCLRFWPWPFGGQETGIPLQDRIESSPIGREAMRTAAQEDLRLLYVGLTRARDRLVLARDKAVPSPWLDSLGASWLADQDGQVKLPDGTSVPCRTITVPRPESIPCPTPPPEYAWFPAPAARTSKLPAQLTPSNQPPLTPTLSHPMGEGARRASEGTSDQFMDPLHAARDVPSAHEPSGPPVRIGQTLNLGARLPVAGDPDEATLGDALHAVLAAELLNPNHPQRRAMAARILRGYGLEHAVQPNDALALVDRFRSGIEGLFHPKQMLVEVPFTVTSQTGQQVTGIMDLLLETDGGWVIIDHKSFPGRQADWAAKALSYSGQLALYREAVLKLKGKPPRTWIHFAVGGGMVEVMVDG
jgi:ATP-dependent exoDNAse (exonuclease V) beta subunit